jgi:hypothetical protein
MPIVKQKIAHAHYYARHDLYEESQRQDVLGDVHMAKYVLHTSGGRVSLDELTCYFSPQTA